MNLHLFGSSSLIGETFLELIDLEAPHFKKFLYSRNKVNYINFDSHNFDNFKNYSFGKNSVIVSFCPIWILSKFIKYLSKNNKTYFNEIRTIIACSSSSSNTKKYAFSPFDKDLSLLLEESENLVLHLCKKNNISCVILQPTLIYGVSKNYKDKNISRIISLMRKFPLIILPKGSGKRQPIHALELSKVTLFFLKKSLKNKKNKFSLKISIGGDEELSFEDLLKSIRFKLPNEDKAKKCFIITIPQKIFIIFIYPVSFISLKTFEALLRICTDLSRFNKVNKFLKTNPSKFPSNKFY